jgi:hypothetical protein
MSYLDYAVHPYNKKKTQTWDVVSKTTGGILGWVYFRPQWRKFVFEPRANTLFDALCLNNIASFCESKTLAWKNSKKVGILKQSKVV